MDLDTLQTLGAAYGALQAIANVLALVLPKHTVAFKIAKWILAGVSRAPSSAAGDAG